MAEMMDALVKKTAGPGLVIEQLPIPVPGKTDVLIKIRKTAICGTDVHIYNWDAWSQKTIKPPMAIGHEYVGEIVALGENVEGFEIGQRVSGEGHIVCGVCRNCRSGNGHVCRNTKGVGVNRQGAFAEYLMVPASNVVPIPDSLPEDVVSFFDAFGNAVHTALTFELVGENVLITGAGPIGIMAAGIARFAGARTVTITDTNDYRLDLATKLGATRTVNIGKEKLADIISELGISEGFDVGLEMSGSPAGYGDMVKNMRNGGKIALLGLIPDQAPGFWDTVIFGGLTLQGIYGRRMYETWYKMGALIDAGLDMEPVITHRFHYTEFEKAFEAMNSGRSGKVVLDWTYKK